MAKSIQSRYGRLSSTKREYKPKHSDKKQDYYRYNILYNRLASHANTGRSKTITVADDVSISNRQKQYKNTSDILNDARI